MWRGVRHQHIFPEKYREANLWPGIRSGGDFPLEEYLRNGHIQAHAGRDNLLSSWTLCANLYFPFGKDPDGLTSLAGFLRMHVDSSIVAVGAVELEYEHDDPRLRPPTLLGEKNGARGSKQTSPDLAFEVDLEEGQHGVVLTEVKFTEHNFYACSVRKNLSDAAKKNSCESLVALQRGPQSLCGQHTVKARRYWNYLAQDCFDWRAKLRCCPAATAGYQLFRQHALAEGLARSSDLSLVVSSLAYDMRNEGLAESLRRTGISDVRCWGNLFKGRARFKVFTHQDWVGWVRQQRGRPKWCDGPNGWLAYVSDRYGFGPGGKQP